MHLHEPFPLRRYLGLSLLGLGCGFVGAVSGARIASELARPSVAFSIPEIAIPPAQEPVEVEGTTRVQNDSPVSNKPGFVIELEGSSWFILDVDPTTIASHVKSHLEPEVYPTMTLAPLHARDLTDELRAWRGRGVVVDAKCVDVVHDFAIVHAVTGDPIYAAEDNLASEKWTRALVDEHGATFVVAKLEHCTGMLARSTLAPAIVAYSEADDSDREVALATDDFIKSALAKQVKQQVASEMGDQYDTISEFDRIVGVAGVATMVAIDPRTQTKWITVHAHSDLSELSCGGPQINFWGLYRVEGDHVVVVKQAKLDSIVQISGMFDLDGDGIPEIMGTGGISPINELVDLDENPIASYDVPFFGCPC